MLLDLLHGLVHIVVQLPGQELMMRNSLGGVPGGPFPGRGAAGTLMHTQESRTCSGTAGLSTDSFPVSWSKLLHGAACNALAFHTIPREGPGLFLETGPKQNLAGEGLSSPESRISADLRQ